MPTHLRSSGHLFPLLKKSVSPEFTNTYPPVEAAFLEPRQAHLFSPWQVSHLLLFLHQQPSFLQGVLHTPFLHNQLYCRYEFPLSYSFSLWYMHSIHTPHSSYLQSCLLRGLFGQWDVNDTMQNVLYSFDVLWLLLKTPEREILWSVFLHWKTYL